jgi:hypothetical protein
MQVWVSSSIAPMFLVILFLYILIYFSSDFIYKPVLNVASLILILFLLIAIAFGAYSVGLASSIKLEDIQNSWNILSPQSKSYYYDNSIEELFSIYTSKMMATGILYLIMGLMSIILVIFAYQYYFRLRNDWRPPLRAKLSDERAKRYIDLYSRFNTDYKRLYELENFKEKGKDKIDNIIDNPQLNEIEQKVNLNEEAKLDVKNEFNVEINNKVTDEEVENNSEKKKRRGLNLRRKRDEIPQSIVEADENTQLK